MVADYYAILEVDPESDRLTIETALARCQPKWSAGTRNPKKKHTYQSYLDLIPAIRQTLLSDPSARAAYDAERNAERNAVTERLLDQFQVLGQLRSAKGGLTETDRADLRKEGDRLGLEQTIVEQWLRDQPSLTEPSSPTNSAGEPGRDVLDPATRRQLGLALDHLARNDLYDLLDLSRETTNREILTRIDLERRRWMQKSQVTAEKTAWLEALAYAQTHLGTQSARKRYDATLSWEAEVESRRLISFALGGSKQIDHTTLDLLLHQLMLQGVSRDRGQILVSEICHLQGVQISGPSHGTSNGPIAAGVGALPSSQGPARLSWTRCHQCHALTADVSRPEPGSTEAEAPSCSRCQASLWWSCPSCQKLHRVDRRKCVCGFRRENLESVQRHLDAARRAFHDFDDQRAMNHLRKVSRYAPNHLGVQKGIDQLRRRDAQRQAVRQQCLGELAAARLVAAQNHLEQWQKLSNPSGAEIRSVADQIATKMRRSRDLIGRAEGCLDKSPSRARELFRQAMAIAVDDPVARQGLERCPPDPPRGLQATGEPEGIALNWSAPLPDGLDPVEFLVVRKTLAIPRSANDGVILARVRSASSIDTTVPWGTPVGYAVFSTREGQVSRGSATVEPARYFGEVQHVHARVGTGSVELTWQPPRNVARCQVVRKQGSPPMHLEDGQAIQGQIDHIRDEHLTSGEIVFYRIFACFIDNQGAWEAVPSRPIVTVPGNTASPVVNLSVSMNIRDEVQISWTPPSLGEVRILRTTGPLPHPFGTQLSQAEADHLAGVWIPNHGPGIAWDRRELIDGQAKIIYTAWTSQAGWATRGVSTSLDRPAQIPPSTSDSLRNPLPSRRLEAEPTGTIQAKRQPVRGLPENHLGMDVSLSYRFVRPQWWQIGKSRRWSIWIQMRPHQATRPCLVVVGHPRVVPISASDGEILHRIAQGTGSGWVGLPHQLRLGRYHLRLFPDPEVDPNSAVPIELIHPSEQVERA